MTDPAPREPSLAGSASQGSAKGALHGDRAAQLARLIDALCHSLRTQLQTLMADCSLLEVASLSARPAAMASVLRMNACIEDMSLMLRHAQALAKASERASDDRAGATPLALAVVAARTLAQTLERRAANAKPALIDLPATTLVAALPVWRVQALFESAALGLLGLLQPGSQGTRLDVHIGEPQGLDEGLRRGLSESVWEGERDGPQAGVEVTISVADASGSPGAFDLSAVFEPFARPLASRSQAERSDAAPVVGPVVVARGQLALARALARSIGGDVQLCRTPTSGTHEPGLSDKAGLPARLVLSVVIAPSGARRWPVVAAGTLRLEAQPPAAADAAQDRQAVQEAIERARAAIAGMGRPADSALRLASERKGAAEAFAQRGGDPSDPAIVVDVRAGSTMQGHRAAGQPLAARVSVVVNPDTQGADSGALPANAGLWQDTATMDLAERLIALAHQLGV